MSYSPVERSADGLRIKQFSADELIAIARCFDRPLSWFLTPPEGAITVTPDRPRGLDASVLHRNEAENGTYVVPRNETVATWKAVWFDTLDAYVKRSTADVYRRVGKRYVVPKLGPIPLQALDAQYLNAIHTEMFAPPR